MDLWNNPLLWAVASAAISALITAAIETTITNRQKNALERQLEEVRHKHALEIEELRHANRLNVEEAVARLRRDQDRERTVAEQRLAKLPKAIEATYKVRYLYLELLNALTSRQQNLREVIINLENGVAELSRDMLEVDDEEFRAEARKLLRTCESTPSLLALLMRDVTQSVEAANYSEWLDEMIEQSLPTFRHNYEEVKRIQSRMIDLIYKESK